jgi:hypothetical protein
MLRRLAAMREAKDRKRLANPTEREPRMLPFHRLEIIVRDKLNEFEIGSFDFTSVRDATRRLTMVRRFYLPTGNPQ